MAYELMRHCDHISSVTFSPNTSLIAGSTSNIIHIWDTHNGNVVVGLLEVVMLGKKKAGILRPEVGI
jgi:WD40 repeat protein